MLSNFDSKLPRKIVKLVCDFQKIVSYRGILVLMRSGPQLLQNIKPIRHLLCTFSSCSVLSIYLIYNIYNFQENQRTKKASLSLTFFHSQPALRAGRQEGRKSTARAYGFSNGKAMAQNVQD